MWTRQEENMEKGTRHTGNGIIKERGPAHGDHRIGGTQQARIMSDLGMHSKEASRHQTIGEDNKRETLRPLGKGKDKGSNHSQGDARHVE